MTKEEIIELISKTTSRQRGKRFLLDRIKHFKSHHTKYPLSLTPAAVQRNSFLKAIDRNEVIEFDNEEQVKRCCEAILHMNKEEILQRERFIKKLLKTIFINYYELSKSTTTQLIRSALCWVDEALYLENCFKWPCLTTRYSTSGRSRRIGQSSNSN